MTEVRSPRPDQLAQLDQLERIRRSGFDRKRDALKRIGGNPSAAQTPAIELAWNEYCEAIQMLESCIAELEALIWKLRD